MPALPAAGVGYILAVKHNSPRWKQAAFADAERSTFTPGKGRCQTCEPNSEQTEWRICMFQVSTSRWRSGWHCNERIRVAVPRGGVRGNGWPRHCGSFTAVLQSLTPQSLHNLQGLRQLYRVRPDCFLGPSWPC